MEAAYQILIVIDDEIHRIDPLSVSGIRPASYGGDHKNSFILKSDKARLRFNFHHTVPIEIYKDSITNISMQDYEDWIEYTIHFWESAITPDVRRSYPVQSIDILTAAEYNAAIGAFEYMVLSYDTRFNEVVMKPRGSEGSTFQLYFTEELWDAVFKAISPGKGGSRKVYFDGKRLCLKNLVIENGKIITKGDNLCRILFQ